MISEASFRPPPHSGSGFAPEILGCLRAPHLFLDACVSLNSDLKPTPHFFNVSRCQRLSFYLHVVAELQPAASIPFFALFLSALNFHFQFPLVNMD